MTVEVRVVRETAAGERRVAAEGQTTSDLGYQAALKAIEAAGIAADEVEVIATGGLAPLVVEEATCFTREEPHLTLLGLEMVFHRNA